MTPNSPLSSPTPSRISACCLIRSATPRSPKPPWKTRIRLLRPLVATAHADPRYTRNLSIAANNLSYVVAKRDPAAAEHTMREAVETLERLSTAPGGERYQSDLALCYNNLAALLSRSGRAADAIGWHQRAAALQEQMLRRAPAVVQHRSDLAVSLNNLGVAYCRSGQVDAAEEPFGRARDLFATLASDYPNEIGYQSALAGLLNNQALALAGAGRHQRAIGIYEAAMKAQRRCLEQAPGSELMQEVLSKMVYNQGRSLVALERWEEALDAALTRRRIWRTSGDRLFGVAIELAGLSQQIPNDELKQRADQETIATLEQAFDNGYRPSADESLATDQRFHHLRNNQQFADLIARHPR